jgi:5-hydroxyisourate hydrolase-like protein (transthyretin family)
MTVVRSACAALLSLAVFGIPLFAVPVDVRVVGSDGKPLGGALIIVQHLQNTAEHEVSRELTNAQGRAELRDLQPGLYRAIATDPYRSWQTEVREFLVKDQPVTMGLELTHEATDDPDVAVVGRLTVHVLDASGEPAQNAKVLLRDAQAHPDSEYWGTTNASGTVSLDVTANASVLVVVYDGRLYRFPANSLDTERTVRLR